MNSRVRSNFRRMNISESSDGSSANNSFYPLSMTADHRTEMHVKFAKVMLIFQGSVTDERRNAVKELADKFKYAGRLISDETYKRETARAFSEEGKLDDFFSYFKCRVKKSCEEGYNLIIIDQSITNVLQMKYYVFLAQTMQYLILPYPPLVNRSIRDRNTQSSSFGCFSKRRVEHPNYFKHLFCGFFLHDVDSYELRGEASLYVQDCFDSLPEFKELFSNIWGSDFRDFYNMTDKRQDLAFCTMKIFQNPLNSKEYMSSSEFQKYYGSMSKLYVVGFIISPHIIAARIRLSYNQKKLWEMPDELEERNKPTVFPSELLKSSKVCSPGEEVSLIASKSNRTIIAGETIHEPTEVFHPRARGRSCHIVLGKVKDAPALNSDYDVPFAAFRERNVVQKHSDDVRPYELDRCLVRRIGKYWYIYLKETLIVDGLFASCCSLETN